MPAMDYELEINNVAERVKSLGHVISEPAMELGAFFLQNVDVRYGKDSANPLEYHNAWHSLDVFRRFVTFAAMVYPYMEPRHRTKIFDQGAIIGCGHDGIQDFSIGVNESKTSDWVIEHIEEQDHPWLNTERFKKRTNIGIIATEFWIEEDGHIDQPHLRTGSRDPIKLISSFADSGGIAMEGEAGMLSDSERLAKEIFGDSSIKIFDDFVMTQRRFLRKRFNDNRIKGDVERYFPNHKDEVFDKMHSAYNDNITSAHKVTLALEGLPAKARHDALVLAKGLGLPLSVVLKSHRIKK